jgi:hypothetical protein
VGGGIGGWGCTPHGSAATRKSAKQKTAQNRRGHSQRLFKQVLICQGVRSGLSVCLRHVGLELGSILVLPNLHNDSSLVHDPVDPVGQPVGPANIPARVPSSMAPAKEGRGWVGGRVGGEWGAGRVMFGSSSIHCRGQAGAPGQSNTGTWNRESLGKGKLDNRERTPHMNSTPPLRMVWHAGDSWLAAAGGGRARRARCSAVQPWRHKYYG